MTDQPNVTGSTQTTPLEVDVQAVLDAPVRRSQLHGLAVYTQYFFR